MNIVDNMEVEEVLLSLALIFKNYFEIAHLNEILVQSKNDEKLDVKLNFRHLQSCKAVTIVVNQVST